jgi:hypothetical protein
MRLRTALELLLIGLALALILLPTTASAKALKVSSGGSIQAAVDRANPGDTVLVSPGLFTEPSRDCPLRPGRSCAVVVTEDDISIVGTGGRGGAVLRSGSDQSY